MILMNSIIADINYSYYYYVRCLCYDLFVSIIIITINMVLLIILRWIPCFLFLTHYYCKLL